LVRIVSTALVVALLASTAAAFALTEGLKLEPSPIRSTAVDKVFSPVCDCAQGQAAIHFRLRKADTATIAIVDASGRVVRTIVRQRFPAGAVDVAWDGRDDAGQLLPEGDYKPRVHLRGAHKTITLPNPITIDTTPPRVAVLSVRPRVISPDGDHRRDGIVVRYRVNEPAHGILYVDGKRRAVTRFTRTSDRVAWFGVVGGEAVRPGTYMLQLGARDRAGNLSRRVAAGPVTVRYVALGRKRIDAVAGTRFAVRVSADAPVRWQLGARSGIARPGTLRLRAPAVKGRYTLTVRVGDHAARAAVFVREPAH